MTLQSERERHDCIKALLARAQDAERRLADLRRALAREHSEWLAFYDLTADEAARALSVYERLEKTAEEYRQLPDSAKPVVTAPRRRLA